MQCHLRDVSNFECQILVKTPLASSIFISCPGQIRFHEIPTSEKCCLYCSLRTTNIKFFQFRTPLPEPPHLTGASCHHFAFIGLLALGQQQPCLPTVPGFGDRIGPMVQHKQLKDVESLQCDGARFGFKKGIIDWWTVGMACPAIPRNKTGIAGVHPNDSALLTSSASADFTSKNLPRGSTAPSTCRRCYPWIIGPHRPSWEFGSQLDKHIQDHCQKS